MRTCQELRKISMRRKDSRAGGKYKGEYKSKVRTRNSVRKTMQGPTGHVRASVILLEALRKL